MGLEDDGTVPMKPYEIMQRRSYIQAIDPSAQVLEDLPAQEALSVVERERLQSPMPMAAAPAM